MKTRGAVLLKAPGEYEVIDLILEEPRQNELQVKMVASGLCHSDDHWATGDIPVGVFPWAGGHEGAGIVEAVGPNTPGYEVGDHVVMSYLPVCGRCRWCASGKQNLCDLGASAMLGDRANDPGSFRVHTPDGRNVGQSCGISTWMEHTVVSVNATIKIDPWYPLDKAALFGCAVGAGWGAAVNGAQAGPGQTIIVMGCGGLGSMAVQGAALAGASNVIAIDPVQFKRDTALTIGATHAFATLAEADDTIKGLTNGQGADAAVVTVGVTKGEHVAQAFSAIRKAGTVAVAGIGDINEVGIPVALSELTYYQKRIQGSLFGLSNPTTDIPMQLQMYRDGKLKIDELITSTYSLDEITKGYQDMHAGKNIRGIVVFD